MERILILSPHYDDAILSCSGLIQRAKRQGDSVTALTLFTESNADKSPLYKSRHHEDTEALHFLGVEARSLKFLDAPYRPGYQPALGPLFQDIHHHQDGLREVCQEVLKFVQGFKPDLLLAPLGIGWHIDHLLTFHAVLPWIEQVPVLFYEDRPYVFIEEQKEMRLGKTPPPPKMLFEKLKQASLTKPIFENVQLTEFEALLSTHHEIAIPFETEIALTVTADLVSAKKTTEAILKYETQWPLFFENAEAIYSTALNIPEVYRRKK